MEGGNADYAGSDCRLTAMEGGNADHAGSNCRLTAMDGGNAGDAGAIVSAGQLSEPDSGESAHWNYRHGCSTLTINTRP
jgi:hypothetical protein